MEGGISMALTVRMVLKWTGKMVRASSISTYATIDPSSWTSGLMASWFNQEKCGRVGIGVGADLANGLGEEGRIGGVAGIGMSWLICQGAQCGQAHPTHVHFS
jgi:hypothetical protein